MQALRRLRGEMYYNWRPEHFEQERQYLLSHGLATWKPYHEVSSKAEKAEGFLFLLKGNVYQGDYALEGLEIVDLETTYERLFVREDITGPEFHDQIFYFPMSGDGKTILEFLFALGCTDFQEEVRKSSSDLGNVEWLVLTITSSGHEKASSATITQFAFIKKR